MEGMENGLLSTKAMYIVRKLLEGPRKSTKYVNMINDVKPNAITSAVFSLKFFNIMNNTRYRMGENKYVLNGTTLYKKSGPIKPRAISDFFFRNKPNDKTRGMMRLFSKKTA
jgi:hypothetical protein